MAGATLATLSQVLKDFYLDGVQEQLNSDVLVTQLLQLDSKNIDLEGNQAVIALHTQRSSGIGSRDELATLPIAGNQGFKKAVYDLKYHYARIQVSGQSIQKTKSNAGAFLRAYQGELDGIRNDLGLDFARQSYGSTLGTDGAIGKIQTGVASATQTLTTNEALIKGFIYPNMLVDVGTAASPRASLDGVATGNVVSDVNVSASTVIFTSSFTSVTNDLITRAGNNKVSATSEMDAGLQKLIPTAANIVGGIDASTNSIWDNQRDSSGTLSFDQLMLNYNAVANQGVKPEDLLVLTTPGIARRLFATVNTPGANSMVRFVNSTMLKGGFSQLSFNAGAGDVAITVDRLHPWGKIHYVPRANFRVFTPGDWDFLAKDGQSVKWVQDKDAFQSVLFRYANLGTNRRNNSLVASGITDTNGF